MSFITKEGKMKTEKGFILVLALLMMLVLTAIGLASMNSSIMEIKLAGNDLLAKKALAKADSAYEEWRVMLSRDSIKDELTDSVDWRYFLAKDVARAKEIGYNSSNPAHNFIMSETPFDDWDVAVVGRHKLDDTGKVVKLNKKPVYYITSHGWEQQAHKVTEIEISFNPSLDPPAALYSHNTPWVHGSSVIVDGKDKCGGENKPGIETTGNTITTSGNPLLDGNPPTITNSLNNINIKDLLDSLKSYANFTYDFGTSGGTLTGMNWGSLTGGSSTSDPVVPVNENPNIVYINANTVNTVTLSGGCHGSGILVVDGGLAVHGGFSWYGIIVVTGGIKFTGGGERNITGGVLAVQQPEADAEIGGNIGILYCSKVKDYLKKKVGITRKMSWREIF